MAEAAALEAEAKALEDEVISLERDGHKFSAQAKLLQATYKRDAARTLRGAANIDRLAALEADFAATKAVQAALQDQLEVLTLTQDLRTLIMDKYLRYAKSLASAGVNETFREALVEVYGPELDGMLRDLLTGEWLPAPTVAALHIYKSEWAELAELVMDLEDVDAVGNGLLLWRPLQHAFDISALCFIYEQGNDRYVAHVLDPSLLNIKLVDRGAELMGSKWMAPPPASRAAGLTFVDIDGMALKFPAGCMQRPLKRLLCYQAHLARKEAGRQGWLQLEFDDFWSEGADYEDKVKAWLGI